MCEHCSLVACSVLNKTECPINTLWRQQEAADQAKADLVAEAEAIVRGW